MSEYGLRGGALRPDHKLRSIAVLALAFTVLAAMALLLSQAERAHTPPSLVAYRGLATWVDVYDHRAWANPEAAVKDMASHGVRTLFIQTGNSSSKSAIFDPPAQRAFIRAAHARGMKVVAWYLPDMVDVTTDYDRIAQAIRFRTPDGQSFDSFALDIESTAVTPESARNQALDTLSVKIRSLVGGSYSLGAIIPSPVGIAKQAGNWDTFPYESVAKTYDVFVPMGYYTFHGRGAASAAADTRANVSILRAQPGCADVRIHLIGGLAEKSTPAEVQAFVKATRKTGCIGASLYGWAGTTAADWDALQSTNR
jgi:hypothetical protein